MSKLTRYEVKNGYDGSMRPSPHFEKDDHGLVVWFSDAHAIEQERDVLQASRVQVEQERDALRASLKELRDIVSLVLADTGFCDHSVGVCYCDWIAALEKANVAIGSEK